MTTLPCPDYRDKLIDYADNELSPDDARDVEQHLSTCSTCQQWVEALNVSLTISRHAWQANYEPVPMPEIPQRHFRLVHKLIAVAASVVVMAAGWWMIQTRTSQDVLTVAQVQQDIQDVEHVASQLVVAQILASCDGTEDMVKRHQKYMQDMYPEAYRVLKVK